MVCSLLYAMSSAANLVTAPTPCYIDVCKCIAAAYLYKEAWDNRGSSCICWHWGVCGFEIAQSQYSAV